MYKAVSEKSSKTLLPELDLFSIPDTSVGVLSSRYIDCPISNAISGTSFSSANPVEFRYSLNKGYLNLHKSYIQFTVGIRDGAGKPIARTRGQAFPLAFTQAIGKTLFKQFQIYLNGVLVEDSSPLYAWRSIIETELNFDNEVKKTNLSLAGYAPDEKFDDPTDPGHVQRRGWLNENGEGQFAATLNLNMFNQSRLLLNYVDFKLVAYLNEPRIVIDSFELEIDKKPESAINYKYEITDIKLLLNEYQLHESVSTSIESLLKQNRMISYPMTNVEMRSYHIPGGRFESAECRLLTSSLPKRIVVCLIDSESFYGAYTKSSFNFKHFDVKEAYLECNGRIIPAMPQNLNFETGQYMPAYLNMLEGSGVGRTTLNNGISRDAFKNGKAFFVFEISPSLDSETFSLINLGTTSFNVKFNKKTPSSGIHAIIHAEYDSMLTFDENRVPHVDAIM